ncbi:hypothetical protein BKA66DRAFT_593138 [Pyrenochaeta sp. MPI-SDFR-AT-0127]|nr:hypothetical protein BKA66DRAFT_593138 [Pyrenochaeta sp. MPI-SDFR-AT-0127]
MNQWNTRASSLEMVDEWWCGRSSGAGEVSQILCGPQGRAAGERRQCKNGRQLQGQGLVGWTGGEAAAAEGPVEAAGGRIEAAQSGRQGLCLSLCSRSFEGAERSEARWRRLRSEGLLEARGGDPRAWKRKGDSGWSGMEAAITTTAAPELPKPSRRSCWPLGRIPASPMQRGRRRIEPRISAFGGTSTVHAARTHTHLPRCTPPHPCSQTKYPAIVVAHRWPQRGNGRGEWEGGGGEEGRGSWPAQRWTAPVLVAAGRRMTLFAASRGGRAGVSAWRLLRPGQLCSSTGESPRSSGTAARV